MNIIIKSIKDYIVEVEGNYAYFLNQVFELPNKQIGVVISARGNKAWLMIDGSNHNLKINDLVVPRKEGFKIQTLEKYFGSVIDVYGSYIYENKDFSIFKKNFENKSSLFQEAKSMMQRINLNQCLKTGVFAIDLLFPIGLGQRQLILGDSKTGKTSLALNVIINNKNNNNFKVIYASVGNKMFDLKWTYSVLKKFGALANTMVIHASSSHSLQQYLLPYVAMNHAENLCEAGFDVLVIIDDLTNHSHILRETALLTNTPVGKEAQPGTLFFAHSSLLERSGKFLNNRSITCLPIVKTTNDDLTSLLASNIISITDGQIVLSSKLKNAGNLPAIDLNLSVSRLGSNVQYPGLKSIVNRINYIYNLYLKNIKYKNVDFELNEFMKKVLDQGKLLMQIIKQKEFECYSTTFDVILSTIVLNSLIKVDEHLVSKIFFLNLYFKHDFTGQLLVNKIRQQIKQKIDIDDQIIHNILLNAMDMYEYSKIPFAEIPFNDGKLKISPNAMKKIIEELWPK